MSELSVGKKFGTRLAISSDCLEFEESMNAWYQTTHIGGRYRRSYRLDINGYDGRPRQSRPAIASCTSGRIDLDGTGLEPAAQWLRIWRGSGRGHRNVDRYRRRRS